MPHQKQETNLLYEADPDVKSSEYESSHKPTTKLSKYRQLTLRRHINMFKHVHKFILPVLKGTLSRTFKKRIPIRKRIRIPKITNDRPGKTKILV